MAVSADEQKSATRIRGSYYEMENGTHIRGRLDRNALFALNDGFGKWLFTNGVSLVQ